MTQTRLSDLMVLSVQAKKLDSGELHTRFGSAQIGGRTSLQRPLSDSCHILYFKAIKILFSYSSVFFLDIFGIVINSKLQFKIALVMRLLGPPNFCIARRP